jgi:hypothetical protein
MSFQHTENKYLSVWRVVWFLVLAVDVETLFPKVAGPACGLINDGGQYQFPSAVRRLGPQATPLPTFPRADDSVTVSRTLGELPEDVDG